MIRLGLPRIVAAHLREIENAYACARALELAQEAVDQVIRQKSTEARITPHPLDWAAVHSALYDEATRIAARARRVLQVDGPRRRSIDACLPLVVSSNPYRRPWDSEIGYLSITPKEHR